MINVTQNISKDELITFTNNLKTKNVYVDDVCLLFIPNEQNKYYSFDKEN